MKPEELESKRMEREKDRHSLENRGYIVQRLLGEGAFSRVYSVEERYTGRRAACKISENIRLLEREEEILKKLRHPLFPEFYESRQEGSTGFLLMEEVTGENLANLIKRGEKLSSAQVAEMGLELAEGLLYLHESRPAIVFRDVKPENIILREDGRVKLLDFGCACITDRDRGTRAGTPGFAAPEQLIEGGEQTHLCDVYGLGRTLQELLWAGTGQGCRTQFSEARKNGREGRAQFSEGQGKERILRKRMRKMRELQKDVKERRDRKRLERILTACVEGEPSARPADMRVVMAALGRFCVPASGDRRGSRDSDFWRKGILCEKNIRKSSRKTS